jgi:hypothetical protein
VLAELRSSPRETLMRTSKRPLRKMQPVPCEPLTRAHYTAGQVLSVEELTAEQDYLCKKLRRHNRTFHQPGIVDGLEVSVVSARLRVTPGLALDAAGNEICVPVAQEASLPSLAVVAYVVLRYTEIGINPIPVLGAPGEESTAVVASRIQESFELGYDPPATIPTPEAPQAPAPPIRLARLRLMRGRWRVDTRFRRPKAK